INQAVDDQISGELIFSGSQNSNLTVTGGQSPGPDVFAASADWISHLNLKTEVSERFHKSFFIVDHHKSGAFLEQGGIYRFVYLADGTIKGLWYRARESTPIGKFVLKRSSETHHGQ
ncbi:MAG: hypothetical protein F6J97_21720, partial [Leptolyngbya sp. SIO4C1]|nr:hypothetical protein [Leptolyngbya sp. SIO4C1]